ncbi:MAG: catalase [Clostridia bacterium]|nr:catalase [Clostridia bacterium]
MIKNICLHLKKIMMHRRLVRHYCFRIGLYKQGVLHDLSKFSPIEFFESARFYRGTSSPIDACKEKNGVSLAWLHHRGRNKHHWEYWVDDLQKGMRPICMPYRYAAEMLCDYLGAGRAYMGKDFSYQKEYEWWRVKRDKIVVHPAILSFIQQCMYNISTYGEAWLTKKNVTEAYMFNTMSKNADCAFDPRFLYK